MTIHGVTTVRTSGPELADAIPAPPGGAGDAGRIDLGADGIDSTTRRSRAAEEARPVAPAASPGAQSSEVEGAAHAYATGGAAGLDAWMDSHPAEMRVLLGQPRADVESATRDALGREYSGTMSGVRAWFDADVIVDRVAGRAVPMLHEAVRRDAVAGIDREIDALEHTSPQALLDRLRRAPEGSAEARLADAIGVRGNEMDIERVDGYRHHALEQLRELRDTVMGETWSPDELPGTAARVAERMGLDRARAGSIAAEALERGTDAGDVAAGAEMASDTLTSAVELVEVAHEVHTLHAGAHAVLAAEEVSALTTGAAIGAGVTLGVAVGALAFGIALHHAIEENRAERREVARSFGL